MVSFVFVCVLPVVHTEGGVVHCNHHQSAAFSEAARKAIMAVRVVVLLHDQQHSRRLR